MHGEGAPARSNLLDRKHVRVHIRGTLYDGVDTAAYRNVPDQGPPDLSTRDGIAPEPGPPESPSSRAPSSRHHPDPRQIRVVAAHRGILERSSGKVHAQAVRPLRARHRRRVVDPSRRSDPANIPHDDEKQGVATRGNPEPKEQVRGRFRDSPQVARTARPTLSRWRHGFEPRWDYHAKHEGHRPSSGRRRPQNWRLRPDRSREYPAAGQNGLVDFRCLRGACLACHDDQQLLCGCWRLAVLADVLDDFMTVPRSRPG
jgi:hypothetical protein